MLNFDLNSRVQSQALSNTHEIRTFSRGCLERFFYLIFIMFVACGHEAISHIGAGSVQRSVEANTVAQLSATRATESPCDARSGE